MTRIEILSACVCLAVAACASGDDAPATENIQAPLERETIIDFLRGFAPDEQQRVQLRSLLQNLDADEFVSRDASMRELLLRPVIPPNMLDDAQESGSTEVRLAIRRLRQSQNPERIEGLLQHAYASITQQHYQGLCTEVLGSLTFAGRGTTIRGGQAALKATVTRDDVAILRHRLDDTSPVLRRTAAVALAGVTQDAAADGLLSLLNDPMAIVRLEVAVALGNAGRRESLKTLIELLNNERLVIRWRSSAALRALTGTSFGYRPTAVSSERRVAAQKWLQWLHTEGDSITLNFPVESPSHIDLLSGNSFSNWIAYSKTGRVSPEQIWEVRDGQLFTKPNQHGDLRTRDAFGDYRLSFDWRMPRGIGDSGVGVMLTDRDNVNPSYLEVQLHTDNAGDLRPIGSFSGWSRGQPIQFRATKRQKSNERHGGLWNHIVIIVDGRDVRVAVNGVMQNEANRGPDKPGHILLRHEGSQVEFRNVHLVPLEF